MCKLSNCLNWKIYCDDNSSLSVWSVLMQGYECCRVLSFYPFFSFKNRQYNMRKLTELPTALIGAERWELFIESICCIPFVEVSVSCTSHKFKTNVFFLNRHT